MWSAIGSIALRHCWVCVYELARPHSSPGGPMGALGSVVRALVPPALRPRQPTSHGERAPGQRVGDRHPRVVSLSIEQAMQEALGRLLVTPHADEDVEDHAS